ncbi:MAG: mechanosensitive ion channel family protein [Nevskiales bacterium]
MRGLAVVSLLLTLLTVGSALLWYAQHSGLAELNLRLGPLTFSLATLLAGSLMAWATHALTDSLHTGRYRWQQWLRAKLQVAPGKRLHEVDWLAWTLDATLLLGLPLLVLHFWGLTEIALDLLGKLSSRGFELGEVNIVPGKILLGVVFFSALLSLTRWIKRQLERKWLLRTPMEHGTRTAVSTIFGYATFILAVLIGLSVAGVQLTNLAVVAGALSVGIGFGLQNVVNNFVSGLILLFERPIRVGDLISVNEVSGYVRRISIRSTEIETGERMSVIVPNSALISGIVSNWTLRDRYGRVSLPISVAYGSDTELVQKLLLDAVAAHPDAIKPGHPFVPGPAVLFVGFANSALNFQLNVFVQDADKRGQVASDLNFAIDRAFRAQGVEMPFLQREVQLRAPLEDEARDKPQQ